MRPDDHAIDNCLKCSLCNTVCPVLAVHPLYPGPKRLGPELERLRLEGIATDTEWVEYCLGCHRCDLVCPYQVNVSEMIARAKVAHRKPLVRGLRDWWFARPGLLGRLTTILPVLFNFVLSMKPARFLMSKLMRIAPQRTFPKYARPDMNSPATTGSATGAAEAQRAVFFPGCYIRYNRPELGRVVIDLLAHNGIAAEVATTECCGVPALANGDAALAHTLARANVKALFARAGAGMCIVTACSSCGHMLKTAFSGILEDDREFAAAAQKIASSTFDLAELLSSQLDAGKLNTNFRPITLRLAYHAPCHQKSQGIGRPWYHLLRLIPGVTIEDLDAGCCGMSGTYGFKQEKYAVSMEIGKELFASIHAAQPQMIATECATCQMQIEHGTSLKAIHPAEILSQAYDGTTAEKIPNNCSTQTCGCKSRELKPERTVD
ncbi:MAG: anaerobic glycerol-3-phosphate dehydrogenase subunit C [Acidobacteriaceae bacterium]